MAFDITPDQVRSVSKVMADENAQITNEVNQLIGRLSTMKWEGAAKRAFENARDEWVRVSADNNKNLAAISDTLMKSADKSQETEDSHAQDFNKFASTLNQN